MLKIREARFRSIQHIIPNNKDDIEQERAQRNLERASLNEHGTKNSISQN